MPKFKVNVPHENDRTEVIQKLRTFMDSARQDSPVELTDVEEDWDDNGNLAFAFSAMGFRIAGQLVTETTLVLVSGELPFAALPFRGALETQLASKIREAIDSPV
ncbi:polyhydroxyalkanoic acid system family protein [Mariniblastus fucicola]|uniref:Polyhydroxyalkanoic acid system protein (PHA_gran_rgn) n=1 Tax=Mariniblastus fucicola TaxID=980251 RepID=A0A5B9P6T8_9BACT|nr:polyhydroxyalkanoic acid system family protein [Mariniblastus fucicola]QEG20640.1 hypothetical protein MFFC18_04900 [Mariniblastus fucicola]